MRLLGHSLNVMTLGGMSLAVGILVDDAPFAGLVTSRTIGNSQRVS